MTRTCTCTCSASRPPERFTMSDETYVYTCSANFDVFRRAAAEAQQVRAEFDRVLSFVRDVSGEPLDPWQEFKLLLDFLSVRETQSQVEAAFQQLWDTVQAAEPTNTVTAEPIDTVTPEHLALIRAAAHQSEHETLQLHHQITAIVNSDRGNGFTHRPRRHPNATANRNQEES